MEPLAATWVDAWNAHDVARVTAWYAPDGSHRMASGNTYAGHDDLDHDDVRRQLGLTADG